MSQEKRHDDAKVFLERFLMNLAEADTTNREQNQLLREQNQALREQNQLQREQNQLMSLMVAQNQQVLQVTAHLCAQVDGLAKRSDYLYEQMGRLGHILLDDGSSTPPMPPMVPGEVTPSSYINGAVQDATRGIVDGLVQGIFPGSPRGSGRPRRR